MDGNKIMKTFNGLEIYDEAVRNYVVGVVTTGTGAAYAAAVNAIDALTIGANFVMVPHVASTTTAPTINVNDLGAKNIRMRLSSAPQSTTQLSTEDYLAANKPVRLVYDGQYWIIDDAIRPNANDLYGVVPITSGGTGAETASQALANLGGMPLSKTMTTAEFNSLETKDSETLYMLTDATKEDGVCYIDMGEDAPSESNDANIYIQYK